MIQSSYVQINGKNQPINVKAANIVCINSGVECPPETLEKHLRMQVDPKYNRPQFSMGSKPKKVNLGNMLSKSKDEDTDLGVQSILSADLPKAERKRRQISLPFADRSRIDHQVGGLELDIIGGDQSLVSQLGNEYTDSESKEEEKLTYWKRINFKNEKAEFHRKDFKVYENAKTTNQKTDNGGSSARVRNLEKEEEQRRGDHRQYEIEKVRPKFYETTDGSVSENVMNWSHYNVGAKKKQPANTVKISTVAAKESTLNFGQGREKDHSMAASTVMPFTPARRRGMEEESQEDREGRYHDRHGRNNKFACPSCKGFWCQTCKSTVPAIYRPIPDENGKYYLHPDAHSVNFYKNHYYKNDQRVCTDCEGTKWPPQ